MRERSMRGTFLQSPRFSALCHVSTGGSVRRVGVRNVGDAIPDTGTWAVAQT